MFGEGECGWLERVRVGVLGRGRGVFGESDSGCLERVSVDGWGGGCLGRVIVGVWRG